MSAKIREQWRVDWEQCEGEARPEAMGTGVDCGAHVGVAMPIMASSGGVDASGLGLCCVLWSGECTSMLRRGRGNQGT